jgi:hypothetical protein
VLLNGNTLSILGQTYCPFEDLTHEQLYNKFLEELKEECQLEMIFG